MKSNIHLGSELRIRIADDLADDLEKLSNYFGMDYSNLTRMALCMMIFKFKKQFELE